MGITCGCLMVKEIGKENGILDILIYENNGN